MNERSAVRLFTIRVLVASLILALFGRLWYLQVLAGDQYAHEASVTRVHDVITTATRGMILDDWGRPYAENATGAVVSVNWLAISQQKDKGKAVLTRLAGLIGEDPTLLTDSVTPCSYQKVAGSKNRVATPTGCYTGAPLQPIPVTDQANTGQAITILERQDEFPGVTATVQSIRKYETPLGSEASNLIGYLGKADPATDKGYTAGSLKGASGIEKQYESALRGTDGVRELSIDRHGNQAAEISNSAAVPGDNVVLSIDAGAQLLMEKSLENAVTTIAPNQPTSPTNPSAGPTHPTQAAGVLINAQTGEIVASGSYPSYDSKTFEFPRTQADNAKIAALNVDPAHPLLNQVIQGQYAPGSTFKLITTSAELLSGRADWNSMYDCPGSVIVGGKPKSNSEGEQLGKINLQTTIAKSCDTVYYGFALADYAGDYTRVVKQKVAPLDTVTAMAKKYGLTAATGVDLPSEANGLIQSWDEKKALTIYYHNQSCIGAYGGLGSKGQKLKPNPNKQKRAVDKLACGHQPTLGDEILYPGNYADEYIGQGTVLATPLQMAMAYAALVNGGKVYSPRVAKAITSPDGTLVKAIKPVVRSTLNVSQSDLDQIRTAMYQVNLTGTGATAFAGFPMDQVQVGGKTGTAQVADKSSPTGFSDTSVFASFAGKPGQDPQYVSIIMVPKGGYGAAVAGPATRLLWDGLYGLEGHPNVLPQGLRTQLPNFSKDGNIVTKGPGITPGTPVAPTGSATPGAGTAGATTTTTQPATPPTGGSTPTALGPLTSPPGESPPARVVAFGASGRSPPRTPDA
ncbi:penicillin-binding protein 2 [Acidothermaceae bacterium B102]|nr:penicillin-binding protein 2 [Acidothermaceae bacterium B102]